MQNKLFDSTKEYAKSKAIRFHMPAHNGEDIGILTAMDITELSFSDNLIESDGVIANTEQNISKAYGTKFALMLTNGATSGVAIALHTAKNRGKNMLIVGEAHKSVHNYAMVFGFCVTQVQSFEDANPNDYDVVLVTSPNYFGNTTDISQLTNTTAFVIVDASHGSHFAFCNSLPTLPTDIADIVILSFHKTLPVLTGGAGLLCNEHNTYEQLCYSRSIIHSSSPSYLTMSSIDKAICEMTQKGQILYEKCLSNIDQFGQILDARYAILNTDDKTRLCICANGINGNAIAKELEKQNIFLEMTYNDVLVAIVTPYNSKHLMTLAKALNNINVNKQAKKIILPKTKKAEPKSQKVVFANIKECIGKVCATNIGIYPPGTPLLTVFDIIDEQIVQFLSTTDCEIFGLINGKIPVYEN